MGFIGQWTFEVQDYIAPWLDNQDPVGSGAALDDNISFDVLDDYSGVNVNIFDAYVDNVMVFSGPSTFIAPYDGPSSAITPTIVDGYDGYHLVLDNSGTFISSTSYIVRVVAEDSYGNQLDDYFSFSTLRQTGILSIEVVLYEITLDVTFTDPMLQNEELINPANYTFDKGMYARKVDIINSDEVRLWVELFHSNDLFTLTVGDDVKDIDGNSLVSNTGTIAPFKANATFTNYNGMVRTWRESSYVFSDTQRVYLSGSRGIDAFKKNSSTTHSTWGQIFDAYGVNTMYLANFPSDVEITDSDPPYLTDQVPEPSSISTVTSTRIAFKVRDDTTAVEITSLTIYINNTLVFNGNYGGWSSNWSGIIDVEHKQLAVELWSDYTFTAGTTISIRVLGSDLLGNDFDTTYSYRIVAPIGGFGGVPFGTSPYGGI
jgi:hypothetical protein